MALPLKPISPEAKYAQMEAGTLYHEIIKMINNPSVFLPARMPMGRGVLPDEIERVNKLLNGDYFVQPMVEEKQDGTGEIVVSTSLVITMRSVTAPEDTQI